MIQREITRKR